MFANAFWPVLYATLYWTWAASEGLILLLTRTRRRSEPVTPAHERGEDKVSDRGSLPLLWLVIVSSIFAGTWIGAVSPHTLFGAAPWVRPLAAIVLACGLGIRWTAVFTLGRAFSANVAIRAGQTIHKTGIFSLVRHPSYSGLLLIFLAIGLHTRSWLGFAICFLPPVAALLYRVRVEEAALHEAFGAQYDEYARTTRRLVPGIY